MRWASTPTCPVHERLDGVLIRATRDGSRTSYLLDMTADTWSQDDSTLAVGQTFTDDQAGISITPLSVSDAGATIEVTLGPAPHARHAKPQAHRCALRCGRGGEHDLLHPRAGQH